MKKLMNEIQNTAVPTPAELLIERLGPPSFQSPLLKSNCEMIEDRERVIVLSDSQQMTQYSERGEQLPSFEKAGPRPGLFFNPPELVCGIVTCGGICPGLNNVIRSIVLTLHENYGATKVLGFRYGYAGLAANSPHPPLELTPGLVDYIQEMPGTIIGSSRGPVPTEEMLETLLRYKVNVLFTIGGDGTLVGASGLANLISERQDPIAIVGIPKTIDNDLSWIMRSFGFSTAVEAATAVLQAAHCEARSHWNGIGLVKLMGRHSGFIAAHATIATGIVNFCLVPEVPFGLDGPGGFLKVLESRIARKDHAVIVVAEGAGQDLFESRASERDASGNKKFKDIGLFIKDQIESHFEKLNEQITVKYFDPSYSIRSLPACPMDSEFCAALGQNAVHAALSGRTNLVVGFWNQNYTHVPIKVVVGQRKQLDTRGYVWQTVLSTTHQPSAMF
jgi:6-phosphofructokinase 1